MSWNEDPYIQTEACIERLWNEYLLHRKLIVAFDYDDTVFDFHKKGHTYHEVVHLLQRAAQAEFYLVLFTACECEKWNDLRTHLTTLDITVSSINENPIPLSFGKHGKIYYNILLDDRAGLGQAVETLKGVLDRIDANESK